MFNPVLKYVEQALTNVGFNIQFLQFSTIMDCFTRGHNKLIFANASLNLREHDCFCYPSASCCD